MGLAPSPHRTTAVTTQDGCCHDANTAHGRRRSDYPLCPADMRHVRTATSDALWPASDYARQDAGWHIALAEEGDKHTKTRLLVCFCLMAQSGETRASSGGAHKRDATRQARLAAGTWGALFSSPCRRFSNYPYADRLHCTMAVGTLESQKSQDRVGFPDRDRNVTDGKELSLTSCAEYSM